MKRFGSPSKLTASAVCCTLIAAAWSLAVASVGSAVEARVSLPAVAREATLVVWGKADVTVRSPLAVIRITPKRAIAFRSGSPARSEGPVVLKQRIDRGVLIKSGEEVVLFLADSAQVGELQTVFGGNGHYRVMTAPCVHDAAATCRFATNGLMNDGLWDKSLWRSLAGSDAENEGQVLRHRTEFARYLSRNDVHGFDWSADEIERLLALGDQPAPQRVPVELILAVASYTNEGREPHSGRDGIHER
jgi:hypothetical protein